MQDQQSGQHCEHSVEVLKCDHTIILLFFHVIVSSLKIVFILFFQGYEIVNQTINFILCIEYNATVY